MHRLIAFSVAISPGLALAADDAARGEALALRWCTDCHVVASDEPGGDAGPAFQTLSLERTEPGLRAWLFQPHPPMPDLNLTADEVDAIMAYIRSLSE